ncbi:MAG: hypothetical protein JWR17_507 [Pseudomonas sp.]|nr:hypothetical protein [Pseudomonas sp.]
MLGFSRRVCWNPLVLLISLFVASLHAAETPVDSRAEIKLEPKALEVLKAMSAKLAGTQGMSFKAITTYEKPSRLGPPLAYSTVAQVNLQRPDHLRVLMSGDGPATEFYYDGKQAYAFAPKENLLAQAEAPSTIDATLEAAYQRAAIYFPFTDVIVANPYQDLSRDMRLAFYIGQSTVIGDTTTDVIAYTTDTVFVQAGSVLKTNSHACYAPCFLTIQLSPDIRSRLAIGRSAQRYLQSSSSRRTSTRPSGSSLPRLQTCAPRTGLNHRLRPPE